MHYLQGRYPVLEKKILAKNMVQYVILCPEIAAAAQPGQFVHILPVGDILFQMMEHINHLDIGSPVQRTFQRTDTSGYGRIGIRTG